MLAINLVEKEPILSVLICSGKKKRQKTNYFLWKKKKHTSKTAAGAVIKAGIWFMIMPINLPLICLHSTLHGTVASAGKCCWPKKRRTKLYLCAVWWKAWLDQQIKCSPLIKICYLTWKHSHLHVCHVCFMLIFQLYEVSSLRQAAGVSFFFPSFPIRF